MEIPKIDVQAIIKSAARDWPLSLRDDPTALGPDDTWLSVSDKANAAIRDNARSALSRALGKVAEAVTMACELELEENDGLADLDEVVSRFVEGLDVDTAPIYEATDWTERLAAIRQTFGFSVSGMTVPTADGASVRALIAGDKRLAHLARLGPTTDVPVVVAIDPATLVVTTEDNWDDPVPAASTVPKRTANGRPPLVVPAGPAVSMARLAELMELLGVTDTDLAGALGVSRTYLSLMKKGQRAWMDIKPGGVKASMAIVTARLEAAVEAGNLLKGM